MYTKGASEAKISCLGGREVLNLLSRTSVPHLSTCSNPGGRGTPPRTNIKVCNPGNPVSSAVHILLNSKISIDVFSN